MQVTCRCGYAFQTQDRQQVSCPRCGEEIARASAKTVRLAAAEARPASASRAPLERLGEFRLVREIGRGGMGQVYEAIQESLNRRVALKVLPTSGRPQEEQVARFRQEAESIAQLKHDNIVEIYTYGEEAGSYYFAMELIAGSNLEALLERGKLPLERILDIALQVTRALARAHAVGVIHRDIKPGNILVEPEGKVWVTDFGLAKWTVRKNSTEDGTLLGTPEYMSPEQAEGRRLGPATDIYSLGVVLYQMLAGQVPFSNENPLTVLLMHLRQEPRDLREAKPDVPLELGEIVMRCLAKDEADRWPTAGALEEALAGFKKEYDDLRSMLEREGRDTEALVVSALQAEDGTGTISRYKRGLSYVHVTGLVADMVNFIRLVSSQAPEEVTRSLEIFFTQVRRTIEERGGTVVELFGDTILAAFGDPIPLEEHPRVALECALELQEVLARLSATLRTKVSVRIGAESGIVLGGYISDGRRRVYNVFGEAIAGAYALEMNAGSNQILVGEALARATQDCFVYQPVGPFPSGPRGRRRDLRGHLLVERRDAVKAEGG